MAEIVDLFPKPQRIVEVTARLKAPDPTPIGPEPAPAITFRGHAAIGICFSCDHVERMFADVSVRTVLCIAPPRCVYVSNQAEAQAFFQGTGKPQGPPNTA